MSARRTRTSLVSAVIVALASMSLTGCSEEQTQEEISAALLGLPGVVDFGTSCDTGLPFEFGCHSLISVQEDAEAAELEAILSAVFATEAVARVTVRTEPTGRIRLSIDRAKSADAQFAADIAHAFGAVAQLAPVRTAHIRATGADPTAPDSEPALTVDVKLGAMSPSDIQDPAQFAVALADLHTVLQALDQLRADLPAVKVLTSYGILRVSATWAVYPYASVDLFLAVAARHEGISGEASAGTLLLQVRDEDARVAVLEIVAELQSEGLSPGQTVTVELMGY